jgi:hypothetical protein
MGEGRRELGETGKLHVDEREMRIKGYRGSKSTRDE